MTARLAPLWRVFVHLHKTAPSEFDTVPTPRSTRDRRFPSSSPEPPAAAPAAPAGTDHMMSIFRRKARPTPYAWKPALDLTDPRVAAILRTFGWA